MRAAALILAMILAISAAVAVYILVLYPLLLSLRLDRRKPAVRKDLEFQPSVSVILAVYNGAEFLRQKLDSLLALHYPQDRVEILVVSDGSTDRTEEIARSYQDRGVRTLLRPHAGKAAALNAALEQADGELLFFSDVRQPLDPEALRQLAANFADPSVGAVSGQMRLLPGIDGEQQAMDLYWRYELWVRSHHSAIDSLFNTTGCIYALRRELATALPADTLSDDAILPLTAFRRNYRVIYEPEAVAYDYPAIPGSEFRRRWRNLAGLWQVHARMPWLFSSSNRMRRHFLPHKFGRLVLPWALLAFLAASLALPSSGWRTVLWSAEAGLAAAALVDRWIPAPLKILRRISSPVRAFLLMNVAALAAVAVFFIPAQVLWKPTRVTSAAGPHTTR